MIPRDIGKSARKFFLCGGYKYKYKEERETGRWASCQAQGDADLPQ